MKITPLNLFQVTLLCFSLFFNFSCNKDSDLLAEYVVEQELAKEMPKEVTIDLANAVFTTEEDKSVSFNLLNNTSSKRNGRRRFKSSLSPTYGSITIQKDSIAIYTPSNDYNGKDDIEITLEVTNEDETTSEVVVNVDVTVEPVTDVVEDLIEVTSADPVVIEPLKNDTFKKESDVTITEVSKPANGTVVINADNSITYTPDSENITEEAPIVENPAVESPTIESPTIESPTVEAPAEETPAEETPDTETPVAETPTEDTFTYTTSVTNPDNSISTETGSVTVTVTEKNESGTEVNGELKAFPTAHGFGRYASGGRGGNVIAVTNLNDSGPGSLRAALTASGSRIVIFRVSGTINITSTIYVNNGNFTIAGETAPGQGVQIVGTNGAWIQVQASNIIIRHLRFRGNSGSAQSSLRFIASGADYRDIIIDHCSFAWANQSEMAIAFEGTGTGDIPQISDVTISNCIFGELYRGILQYKGHNNFSYYRNYFYNIYQRSPEANRPIYQEANTLSFEAINQLWHNNYHFTLQAQVGSRVTAIGNKRTGASGVANSGATELVDLNIGAGPSEGVPSNSYLYASDNLNAIGSINDGATAGYLKGAPYNTTDITGDLILPAANIDEMLPNIGAFHWDRDAVDTRFINHYINSNGGRGPYTGTPPTLKTGTAYADSDGDGMSDDWERNRGLNPNSADNNGDDDKDGYSNLEEFLHVLAKDY